MTTASKRRNAIPGLVFTAAIAIPAYYLGILVPLIGGPVLGILFGMIMVLWQRPAFFEDGISIASKEVLQLSIILLGFEMNLNHVFSVGNQSFSVMIFTLSVAFLSTFFVGHYLNVPKNIRILVGVGTAICGGSAIAATAPIISANNKEIAYSISTIFLFNIAAVFIFPFAGHLLGMSDFGFGMWAGTAINDTSSVVAAGYGYSHTAGDFAIIVKLTRTLMIIPIAFALAVFSAKKSNSHSKFNFNKVLPWFILGFLASSLVNTSGIIAPVISNSLAQIGKFCIIMSMAAIGLNTNLKMHLSNGVRPILLGLTCWISVALVSLAVQHYIGLW